MPITRYPADQLHQQLLARWDGTPFWTEEDAYDALNEAFALTNLLTGYWRTSATLLTVIGQHDYTLPAALVYGMRVRHLTRPLYATSRFDLDYGQPAWRGQTGTPQLWAPVALQRIVVWPAPAVGGQALVCDGVAATPVLTSQHVSADMDEVTLGAVLDCALHLCAFKEGSDRFVASHGHFRRFLQYAAGLNAQFAQSAWYRRYMGLDRARDFRPTRQQAAEAATLAQTAVPFAPGQGELG